jgi:voltage-gated potassium channel
VIRLLVDLFRNLRRRSDVSTTIKVILATLVIVWFAASGYLYFEIEAKPHLTWNDGFWWALVTMTTVGYGDHFPESFMGRYMIGVPTMMFGISILGYLLANVAALVVERKSREIRGMSKIKLTDHVLVIHYSDSHRIAQVIMELQHDEATRGKAIVLIDGELDELPPELAALNIRFVRGNPARQATLEQAGYADATHAIVLSKDPRDVRSDDLNLAVTMTLEGLKSEIRTVTECVDPESLEILHRTGSDSIVCASRFSSSLLVQELLDPGVQAVFGELTTTTIGQQFYVVPVKDMQSWTFEELSKWSSGKRLLAVGVKRGEAVELNPTAEFKLQKGDEAVLIGKNRPPSVDTKA